MDNNRSCSGPPTFYRRNACPCRLHVHVSCCYWCDTYFYCLCFIASLMLTALLRVCLDFSINALAHHYRLSSGRVVTATGDLLQPLTAGHSVGSPVLINSIVLGWFKSYVHNFGVFNNHNNNNNNKFGIVISYRYDIVYT